MSKEHVHDCSGPDLTCACGWRFTVPDYFVSYEFGVSEGGRVLGSDAFSTDSLDAVADALEQAAEEAREAARSRWASE